MRMYRLLVLMFVLLPVLSSGQQFSITVGSNDGTTENFPISTGSNYKIWEGIYRQSEIDSNGYITKISFNEDGSTTDLTAFPLAIYLKTTTDTSLPTTAFSTTGYTLVYYGDFVLEGVGGWQGVRLLEPFYYDNSDNLMVAIKYGYQESLGDAAAWAISNMSGNYFSRYSSDTEAFDTEMTSDTKRPQIKFEFSCLFLDLALDTCICTSDTIPLSRPPLALGGGGGYQYSWSPTSTLDNSNIESPNAFPEADQTYTVTVTSNQCPTGVSASIDVNFFPSPSEDIEYFPTKTLQAISLCSEGGRFYDSGGSDEDYSCYENFTYTIYPDQAYHKVKVVFNEFSLEDAEDCAADYMEIYNGPDDGCTLLGTYCTTNPGTIQSTHVTGALTFVFHSDDLSTGTGWDVTLSNEDPGCTTMAGTAAISSSGNGCSSGNPTLSLTNYLGDIIDWEISIVNNTNFQSIDCQLSSFTYSVNTPTYFRAVVKAGDDTCYSNQVYYNTGINYYVNNNSTAGDEFCTAVGSSDNSGLTPGDPLNSLSNVLSGYALCGCDTVFIDSGAYNDHPYISSADDGTNDTMRVVIYGAGPDKVSFSQSSATHLFEMYYANYVNIERIKICPYYHATMGLRMWHCSYNEIRNCHFWIDPTATSNYINIVLLYQNSHYNYFENNFEEGCFYSCAIALSNYGSSYYPSDNIIRSNIMKDMYVGVNAYNSYISNTYQRNVVANNIINSSIADLSLGAFSSGQIYNNFILGTGDGMRVHDAYSTNNVLYHNSFYNGLYNIDFQNQSGIANWNLRNNIFYCTSTSSTDANLKVTSGGTTTFAECDYNLFYKSSANPQTCVWKGTNYSTLTNFQGVNHTTATGNGDANSVSSDPLYKSTTNGNLNISSSSPSYKAGVAISGYSTDINQQAFTSPPSMGAGAQFSTAAGSYAHLSRELDGSFYLVQSGYLRFVYDEEYYESGSLTYKIYDYERNVELETGDFSSNEAVLSGTNYYDWNIVDCSTTLPNGHFLLEVENDKGEKFYLRFYNATPFTLYCDPIGNYSTN